jgi:hypothetical protein
VLFCSRATHIWTHERPLLPIQLRRRLNQDHPLGSPLHYIHNQSRPTLGGIQSRLASTTCRR